ncbi:hypothetical protein DL770_005055 [Monosporascus sp. CRB-9-2]|nr:hypothetical protein DL770_005055 [Monosporascus sp. CRB-9-2]
MAKQLPAPPQNARGPIIPSAVTPTSGLTPSLTLPPRRPSSPSPPHPVTPRSLPITPPTSPGSHVKSRASLDTNISHRSHQEYLDSLQPPSSEEFARLARVQEEREKQHRHRDHELQRQNRINAWQSMEARRDFMATKADEKHHRRSSVFRRRHSEGTDNSADKTERGADGEVIRSKAATVIQKNYRGYRTRREMQGHGLTASTRWSHAIKDARWREMTKPRARSETMSSLGSGSVSTSRSAARQKWSKAAMIARRAGADEDSSHSTKCSSESSSEDEDFDALTPEQKEKMLKAKEKRKMHARVMGLQYFLEMVDVKHRYGSNLRTYHEEWIRSDTKENFFYWLDYGEGRNLDLAACPRERLDREQVRYLSREERQYYLVSVDGEGRLVWAKNGVRIDTTEEWKDSIYGIVPVDDPTPAFAPGVETHVQSKPSRDARPEPHDHSSTDSASASSRESRLEAAMAAKYANTEFHEAKGVKKIRHVSAATIFNKLLRKSVRKNTWIFVADTSFRLYVGMKNSGAFQHSSFLHGSRISAAGLIKIKNGRLASLSPLSGHYRPPASNFRAFVHNLEDAGVDMSHVSISKSYAVLVGLEAYVKTKKKGKELVERLSHRKLKMLHPEEAAEREEALKDKSESAARERDVLEKQREEEEVARAENKATARFLQRLGFRPSTPGRQNPNDDVGHPEHEPNDS